MSKYTNTQRYNTGLTGEEGYEIETKDFELLKSEEELTAEVKRLVEQYMLSDEIDTKITTNGYYEPMECDYETYTDMIVALLENIDTVSPIEINNKVFEELVKNGYVSNGLVKQSDYYMDKYQCYNIRNSAFKRAMPTDEVILSQDALLELLVKNGQIEVLAENTYKVLK